MVYFLLGLTVILSGLRSVLSKIGNKYTLQKQNMLTFNFLLFLASGIIIAITYITGGEYRVSFYTASLAVLYAFFTLMSQILFMKATDNGDVALSSLIYFCGFLFPTVFGAIAYKEDITALKVIGILVILLSFAVSTTSDGKRINRKWFIYVFTAMFSSGAVGVLQKIFRMSEYKGQQNGFLLVAFLVIIVAIIIIMPKERARKFEKGFLITSLAIGICFGAMNIINTYLSGEIPSIIMFPVVNGGGIISSGVFAYLFLSERLSLQKWIGILTGLAGIILIAI